MDGRYVAIDRDAYQAVERMAASRHPLRDRIIGRCRRGEFASVREIVVVASVPRQTISRWLREAEVDLEQMRMQHLAKLHEQEERYLAGLPPKQRPTKKLLRWIANKAKREWDQRHAAEQESLSEAADRDPCR